jgi:thiamine transport system substrate-binding protein
MKPFVFRRFPALVLAALFFSTTPGVSAAGAGERPTRAIDDRQAETQELVIYTYDSLPGTLRRAITGYFEETYGVTVDLQRLGDTGAVYTQLFLERNNPRADAVIGLDTTFLPRLRQDNLLERHGVTDIPVRREELAETGDGLVVPFDFGYITLNMDTENLAHPPSTWEDLLRPELTDSIIMLNPGTSSPGRNFLLLTLAVFGDGTAELPGTMPHVATDYLEFWQALRPNILTITGGWSDGYGLYTQGEAPIVVSYETSPAFHRHFEETDRYAALILEGGAYLQVEVAGIVRGARNRRNAERLMEYLVSEDFQELIALSQIMYPIHPDVALPPAFEAGPVVEAAITVDSDLIEERFAQWLEAWEDVMR